MLKQLLISILLLSSYSASAEDPVNQLKWLSTAHPEVDSKNAFSKNDYRFYAILGYSIEIPGVTECEIKAAGQKIIAGTSDAIESWEHQKLNVIAREYALMYNINMSRLLRKENIVVCN